MPPVPGWSTRTCVLRTPCGYIKAVRLKAFLALRGCAAGACMLVLAGCSSPQEPDAEDAADRFAAAVTSSDADTACGLLAPATRDELEQSSGNPCVEAILDVATSTGPRDASEVYGSMAQIAYVEDTLFLSRFDERWLVVAASCARGAHQVYDCHLQGR
jgi:hypothetical protein